MGSGWRRNVDMKWFFITLLTINVIYLGWELDRETKLELAGQSPALSVPESAGRLRLISEMPTPPESRQTYSNGSAGNNVADIGIELAVPDELLVELPDILLAGRSGSHTDDTCYRYGPIPDDSSARSLNEWFDSRQLLTQVRFTEEPGLRMFWIYLAPVESRESALEVLREMRNKGIEDYRLINRGDLENAISLGLFSSREAVDARLRVLGEKGYIPVVVPYTNAKKIYWIDVLVPPDRSDIIPEAAGDIPARHVSAMISCLDIFLNTSGS